MSDLWFEASEDHEAMAREASLALADAELESVMPFLLASRSQGEFEHRAAYAYGSISSIAASCGIDAGDLMAIAARRYDLYRQALAEGTDPLSQLAPELNGSGFGSGPEKPYEHDEGPDLSHGYSEVPCGGSGGPDPSVVRPRPPATGPVQEATGSLRRQADAAPGSMMTPSYTMPAPPDSGTGRGSLDTGMPSAPGGATPSLPAGVTSNGDDTVPLTPSSIGRVTSSADPVRRRVMAVTAAIRETNPHLPPGECERVARQVVGRYLREADLSGSVMSDQPVEGGGGNGQGSGSSGDSGHGGLGGVVQHGLEWQGIKSLMGGGAADLAGVAAL